MPVTPDELERDLVPSCWVLERQGLLEDKQILLDENVQLHQDLLQLQQEHIALLQLVAVQQQQLQQQALTAAASQRPAEPSKYLQAQLSVQSSRSLQQQQVLRPASSMRDSLSRDSSILPLQLSRQSTPQNAKKTKSRSVMQRSIQSLLTPCKSWSKSLSNAASAELPDNTAGTSCSGTAAGSSKAIIDVAALTGLARTVEAAQQQQEQRDSVSSSMQYDSSGLTSPFASSQCEPLKQRSISNPAGSKCRSSSPGWIMGASTAAGSRFAKAGGWRVNRPSPLTHLPADTAAARGQPVAAVGRPGLPPHPTSSSGSKYGTSGGRYCRQRQQQQQLETVGSNDSEALEPQSCPATVFVDANWSQTPRAVRYNRDSIDDSTPSSSSSSRDTESKHSSSSSSGRSLQVLAPGGSSNASSIAGGSIVGSDCGRDSVGSSTNAGPTALIRDDTAKLLGHLPQGQKGASAANDAKLGSTRISSSGGKSSQHVDRAMISDDGATGIDTFQRDLN